MLVIKTEKNGQNITSELSSTVTNLFNHVSTLELIVLKAFVHVDGQDGHLAQVLKLCPVSQEPRGRVGDVTNRRWFPISSCHFRQQTELCSKRNSSFDCTGLPDQPFILIKSTNMRSGSRHCLVLQPALMLEMEFLQILQRDVLLFFSASKAQSLQAILYPHEKKKKKKAKL